MQLSMFTSGALWVLMAFFVVMVTGTPVCERTGQYIQDPDDCSVFYQCVRNTPVEKHCMPHLVFSQRLNVCVWPNSIWDDCPHPQPQPTPPTPAPLQATSAPPTPPPPTERLPLAAQEDDPEPCSSVSSGLHLDSSSCSKYFNCSLRRTQAEPFLGFFSQECPYTELFDAASLSCRPARLVDCGTRPFSKDPCDWVVNMCGGPNCRECSSRMVDCTALREGPQPYPGREDTPYYIECRDGWFVKADLCPQDGNGRYMQFSSHAGECVSLNK